MHLPAGGHRPPATMKSGDGFASRRRFFLVEADVDYWSLIKSCLLIRAPPETFSSSRSSNSPDSGWSGFVESCGALRF
jgi:hypothetical protein